ncbi:MAG: phosphotyrosine protein phosphatase [Pseudomonadota bacterium]
MESKHPIRVLFICSMNQRRSLTAEHIFADTPELQVRSAGTARRDERAVTAELVAWADMICVMDQRHADWIEERMPGALGDKTLHVLNVPDEFRYMDEDLVALLKGRLTDVLS